MTRSILFFVVLAGLAVGAAWLADTPGSVSVDWRGYRLDTSVAVLVAAVVVVAVLAAVLYRAWGVLASVPGRLARARTEERRRRGYLALTRGLVAASAGDVAEAQAQARRADALLGDPPVTMLLSAQTAQLTGDTAKAAAAYHAMIEQPETEFLGLRGLLVQARTDGDDAEALRLATRAAALQPRSRWAVEILFDLQTRRGLWAEAEATLDRALRNRVFPEAAMRAQSRALMVQRAFESEAAGRAVDAMRAARRAIELDPTFAPAVAVFVRLLIGENRHKRALAAVEAAWAKAPHPDLVEVYWDCHKATDPLHRARLAQGLQDLAPGHPESHLAVASAALEARLWGEARRHLELAGGETPTARVSRLMARLEESEHGDMGRAHQWLVHATMAAPDPAWVCESCGNVVADWAALCGSCGRFARFRWTVPRRVGGGLVAAGDRKALATPAPAA